MTTADTPPKRTLCRGILRAGILSAALFLAWFGIHTGVSAIIGVRDKTPTSDVIVVFGNRVEPSGAPSPRLKARLDRALELYVAGSAPAVIVSGGFGKEGHDEALVMRAYLIENGVPPEAVVADGNGNNTYLTAKNSAEIMRRRSMRSAILVTQYYHIPRACRAFHAFGIADTGHAHARMGPEVREPYVLFREFCAYYYYLVRKYDAA